MLSPVNFIENHCGDEFVCMFVCIYMYVCMYVCKYVCVGHNLNENSEIVVHKPNNSQQTLLKTKNFGLVSG